MDPIETTVNVVIALGFLILASGVGLWLYKLCTQFSFSFEITLIAFGVLILILGLAGAKIFSKVGG